MTEELQRRQTIDFRQGTVVSSLNNNKATINHVTELKENPILDTAGMADDEEMRTDDAVMEIVTLVTVEATNKEEVEQLHHVVVNVEETTGIMKTFRLNRAIKTREEDRNNNNARKHHQ